jgi:hypothetical protein
MAVWTALNVSLRPSASSRLVDQILLERDDDLLRGGDPARQAS